MAPAAQYPLAPITGEPRPTPSQVTTLPKGKAKSLRHGKAADATLVFLLLTFPLGRVVTCDGVGPWRMCYNSPMNAKPKIAVVAMQGDFAKHISMLNTLGADAFGARLPQDIDRADGVILPGGESTAIGKLLARYGMDEALKTAHAEGKPIYGTCAGLILLSKGVTADTGERGGQPTLGLLNAVVARNAFGRQVDSFETPLDVPLLGPEPLGAVFIRAPYVVEAGPEVDVLARHDGKIVFVRQGNVLGSAFHPELTGDDRVHRFFLSLVTK